MEDVVELLKTYPNAFAFNPLMIRFRFNFFTIFLWYEHCYIKKKITIR